MPMKSQYAVVKSADMPAKYVDCEPLMGSDAHVEAETKEQRAGVIPSRLCTVLFIAAFLLGFGLHQVVEVFFRVSQPKDYARTDFIKLPTVYKPFYWWTQYSEANDTEVDTLWESINTDHGVIAMGRAWALKNHWPQSMHLPTDDSKNVYVLEGYHLLHCLGVIRKTFWEAVRNRPNDYSQYTYDPSHSGHCFDALRQHIICDANPTPLWSYMEFVLGDRQPRKCRDWNALREFATENSACFQAVSMNMTMHDGLPSMREAYNHCPQDSNADGVQVDSQRHGNWTKHV